MGVLEPRHRRRSAKHPAAIRIREPFSTGFTAAARALREACGMDTPSPTTLEVFFDGGCPACRREMAHYRAQPGAEAIGFTDAAEELTRLADVGLDPMAAIATLHARDADGTWHIGVPAFREIWLRLPRYAPWARRFAWAIDSRALAWAYAVFCRLRLPRRCRDGRCPA
jgi:predicted DCC family thiol-disulfide oxidoreductase YuxK